MTTPLALPFNQLFSDREEAKWAFSFIRETLNQLGVPGPYDPRVAVVFARSKGNLHLRIHLGYAEVLEFCDPNSKQHGINLPFLTDNLPTDPDLPHWPLDREEDEPKVFIYKIPTAKVRTMPKAWHEAYHHTLSYIAERLTNWEPSPFRRQHQAALCEAFFNAEKQNLLLENGLAQTAPFRKKQQYWKISPGTNGVLWSICREQGYIAVGWPEFGDLSAVNRVYFEAQQTKLLDSRKDWTQAGTQQVWKFAKQIHPGDRVVANRGTTEILGVGTITGPYYFEPGATHPHRYPVRWDDVSPRTVNEYGWRRTLIQLDKEKFFRLVDPPLEQAVAEPSPSYQSPPPSQVQPTYLVKQCADETGFEEALLARWLRVILRKKQVIISGPPGTGKTYLAHHLARLVTSNSDGFIQTIQFHPAYSYEEFIEGIRPTSQSDGSLTYPLVPGRFLAFCREAEKRSGHCVLIIDEINRANLAQVFGELMYLLEYRTAQIPLAGGTRFTIPAQVVLIGTMNTADRSIALLDHALRRRFSFLSLAPNYDVLRRFHADASYDIEPLIQLLERINAQIGNAHYALGTTYFLAPNLETVLQDIWEMEVEPYLTAYFFDQPDQAALLSWAAVSPILNKS